METQQRLIEAIRQADRLGAAAILNAWSEKHGSERILTDVLEPTLRQIGEEWTSREAFTLAQGYVAAKVAEDALVQIARAGRQSTAELQPVKPSKGPVVMGNIEDDFHALGRRMVCTFLAADGWIIHDLGNDVPAVAFIDKAVEIGARVIGVSAMMLTTALNIRKLREEIDRHGQAGKIQLAVGGAVFVIRPGLMDEVGGDGTSRSAVNAPALFADLWNRSLSMETRS